jgi:hypothetical protein
MATSPDFLRLAAGSIGAFQDKAFDSLRDIVGVDAHHNKVQAERPAQIALEKINALFKLSMKMAHMYAWRWDPTLDVFEFALADGEDAHLPSVFPGMREF